MAKTSCACFFREASGTIFAAYLNLCLFARSPDALHRALSYATEVFDDGESNGRCTKAWFQREHVETASETPRYLVFFVDLTSLRRELAFGPPTIR